MTEILGLLIHAAIFFGPAAIAYGLGGIVPAVVVQVAWWAILFRLSPRTEEPTR